MKTARGKTIFDACTFIKYPFTKRAFGIGVRVDNSKIRQLQKTNPNAYVHVLYDSSRSKGFLQVKNIRFDKYDK